MVNKKIPPKIPQPQKNATIKTIDDEILLPPREHERYRFVKQIEELKLQCEKYAIENKILNEKLQDFKAMQVDKIYTKRIYFRSTLMTVLGGILFGLDKSFRQEIFTNPWRSIGLTAIVLSVIFAFTAITKK
jgi:hypothetical protein